jgi:UDP-glucose 4-epimerase
VEKEAQAVERILITGGAGFIGIPLAKTLLKEGHQVAILDNFRWPGRRELLPRDASFVVFEGDIRDRQFVRQTLATFVPSVVYHLAAIHYIPECESNPSDAVEINVLGTQILLEYLRPLHIKRVFLASTSSVYLSTGQDRKSVV